MFLLFFSSLNLEKCISLVVGAPFGRKKKKLEPWLIEQLYNYYNCLVLTVDYEKKDNDDTIPKRNRQSFAHSIGHGHTYSRDKFKFKVTVKLSQGRGPNESVVQQAAP